MYIPMLGKFMGGFVYIIPDTVFCFSYFYGIVRLTFYAIQ